MPPIKFRRRQIEQAHIVLIDQPAAFFGRGPVLARDRQRRMHARRLPFDDGERLAHLVHGNGRNIAFENAGFLRRDVDERVAEKVAVVERQFGDDAGNGALDDIRGVEPAAETNFKQHHIGRMARKQQKAGRGLDLEYRDRRAAVLSLAFGKRVGKFVVVDELAAALLSDTKSFVDAHEIRRSVNVNVFARGFEDRAHEGDGGAFAVGAGDMNNRRQTPLRMIERSQNELHAVEPEVDPLGM